MKMTLPRAILQGAAYLVDLGGTLSRRGARDPYEADARALRDAWRVIGDDLRSAIKEESRSITQVTPLSETTRQRTDVTPGKARELSLRE
jgi:hypothetical protein